MLLGILLHPHVELPLLDPPDPTCALLLVMAAGAGQYLPPGDPLQVTLSLSLTHSLYYCSLLLDVAVGAG